MENLSIYDLLSGNVDDFLTEHPSLNWPRRLGAHVWFSSEKSLMSVLDRFVAANASQYHDTCFEILSLFTLSDGNHDADAVAQQFVRTLDPLKYTKDPLDYSLSWFLYAILREFDLQGVPDVAKHSVITNFAAQLEWGGMWSWAIYILQSLPNASSLAYDVLLRNYPPKPQRVIVKDASSPKEKSDTLANIREISALPPSLQISLLCDWLHHVDTLPFYGNQELVDEVMSLLDRAFVSLDQFLISLGIEESWITDAKTFRSNGGDARPFMIS